MICFPCRIEVPEGSTHCPSCSAPMFATSSGVRAQVFEVIVRQAIAGAPWKEICAGPMQVNQISTYEVEEEVRRRGYGAPPGAANVRPGKKPPGHSGGAQLSALVPTSETILLEQALEEALTNVDSLNRFEVASLLERSLAAIRSMRNR